MEMSKKMSFVVGSNRLSVKLPAEFMGLVQSSRFEFHYFCLFSWPVHADLGLMPLPI